MQDAAPDNAELSATILGRRAGIMQGGYFLRRLFHVTNTLSHLRADAGALLQAFLPSSPMDEMPTLRRVCMAPYKPNTLQNWRISKSARHFHKCFCGAQLVAQRLQCTMYGRKGLLNAESRRKRNAANHEFSF